MSTITLPNIRVSSDLTVRVRLKDGGVAIDWSTLNNIKAHIYSDAQRALAGRCDVSVDAEDSTILVCSYAANKPQYVGINRIVVSAKYMGETKTYDKPAFNFVRWTADQEGEEITIDDPDVDVEIDVEDISSSILQEAVEAAFEAADRANDAAAAAEHMVDIHTGPEGKSAYEVAVEEGYVGTEEEWLASLVGPQGPQGIQGETGEAAGFGTASASLTEDGGAPGVTVAASGSDTAKNFAFTFKNLKGDKGDKGDQGNTGSSVEYPYELVNNLTTNDATKGLTAAMGVTLEGEVSQLEAKVSEKIDLGEWNIGSIAPGPLSIPDYASTTRLRMVSQKTISKSGNYTIVCNTGYQFLIYVVGKITTATWTNNRVVTLDAGDIYRIAVKTDPETDFSGYTQEQVDATIVASGIMMYGGVIVQDLQKEVEELAIQKIEISACTNYLPGVTEGSYFYQVSQNKFYKKLSGDWNKDELADLSHIRAFYEGQIAIYNGAKLACDVVGFDKLSRISINDLGFQNKQVNALTGELGTDNPARLCSDMFVSNGFEITIANGYYMYLYVYDINGNYLGENENNNAGSFVFAFPFSCKLRLVFKHTDGTTAIPSITGVVESSSGLFDYAIKTNEVADNAITLSKIDKSENTFDEVPKSDSNKLLNSSSIYSAIKYNISEETKNGVFVIENLMAKLPVCNVMRANNIYNYSSLVTNRIRNDSGTVVTDYSSAYLSQLVPAYGGCYVKSTVAIQRIYYLDANGDWIGRTPSMAMTQYQVPATFNGQTIYYLQFQFQTANISSDVVVTWGKTSYRNIGTENLQFATNAGGVLYDNTSNLVWRDDFGSINYYSFVSREEMDNSGDLITDLTPWEPSSVDSGYSNPETGSGRSTYRSAWTAEDKYKYYDFLEHYYDGYLGETSSYKVTKRMLWESGQCDGHEVYEYDFCPINYKYVIMLSAGMNANETQGIWGLATFIRCLMNGEESVLSSIKTKVRFKVIPIINAAGFDYDSPLKYGYVESREVSTEVNPNFNFNYKTSWQDNTATWSYKGPFPDSCVETRGLKDWINANSGKAIFWADLHTGRWENEYPNKQILDIRFGSLSSYYAEFNSVHAPLIKQFYINKGFVTAGDSIGAAIDVRNNVDYQKHRYAVDVCKIESCMPEMHIESSGYGTDGMVNNDPLGIKAYVLQIRQLVIYALNKYISANLVVSLPEQGINNLQNKF